MGAYESGLEGEQGTGGIMWESATDHLTRKIEWMRLSIDRSSLTLAICGPHGELQPPNYLLEIKHIRL